MVDEEFDDLRSTAESLAREAGDLARAMLAGVRTTGSGGVRADLGATAKSTATDPVTAVDTAVEDFLRAALAGRRPGDTVLGEEGGGGVATPGVVRWVVDPIDGTVNLLYGLPFCAVSVAAELDGRVVAGAVHVLGTRETFSARLGGGATVDAPGTSRRPLRASSCSDLSLALVGTGFSYSARIRAEQGRAVASILPRVRDIRRLGAAAVDLCLVADGRLDAYYERCLKPWDHAAGGLVAAEAGAIVSTSSDDAVATVAVAPGLAVSFVDLLRESGVSS